MAWLGGLVGWAGVWRRNQYSGVGVERHSDDIGKAILTGPVGRGVYFRTMFRNLLDALRSDEPRAHGERLGGYDLSAAGELIWGMD